MQSLSVASASSIFSSLRARNILSAFNFLKCVLSNCHDECMPPIPLRLENKDSPKVDILPTDRLNIAWALHPDAPFEPLLIFSNLSLLYVYSVKKERIVSYLRGHGGVSAFIPYVCPSMNI